MDSVLLFESIMMPILNGIVDACRVRRGREFFPVAAGEPWRRNAWFLLRMVNRYAGKLAACEISDRRDVGNAISLVG
jgi:hypothetical protein